MTDSDGEERRPLLGGKPGRSHRADVEGHGERDGSSAFTYSWRDIRVSAVESPDHSAWDNLRRVFGRDGRLPRAGKQILKKVSGVACPREMTAIMGSSGSGKTTLLNALTFRTGSRRTVTGDRLVNGRSIGRSAMSSLSAYVQQDDAFLESLTVREHLTFHALVRMDESVSHRQRSRRVDEVIREFGLGKCEDTTIRSGGRGSGISGGERKRLSFASEVLTDPPMMFCDEPTSGLDSATALTVMSALRAMAEKGKTVVFTVHQPSSEMYSMFDKIILVAEGRTAFLGSRDEASDFFGEIGIPCPLNYNPADHYVQVLAVAPNEEGSCVEKINFICDSFDDSTPGLKLLSDVGERRETQREDVRVLADSLWIVPGPRYKARWTSQFRALLWRSWLCAAKDPTLVRMRFFQNAVVSLLIGVLYFRQEYDQIGVMNINGVLFTFLTNATFQNVYAVITVFCSELPVFLREHSNGMYRVDVYFLCKTLAEVPAFLALPMTFVTMTYYAVGLAPGLRNFFSAMLIVVLAANAAASFGYLISAVSNTLTTALSVGPPVIIPFLLFGGYLLNLRSIPGYFKWLSYFSWFRYGNEALLVNQWSEVEAIECTVSNSTCPKNGRLVLELYDFRPEGFLFDLASMLGLVVLFRFSAFLSLLWKSYKKSN